MKLLVRGLVWGGLVVMIGFAVNWWRYAERREMERLHPVLKEIRESQEKNGDSWPVIPTNIAPTMNKVRAMKRASEFTQQEQAELVKKFQKKFRPAVDHWLSAYEGHVPFKAEDFTLEKFHSTLGSQMFTFMITGDLTLTLVESRDPDAAAKVGYLMSRKAASEMNRLPGKDFVPVLNLPVTREDVIHMVNLDSGTEFSPNEVMIKPTAKACALNGGAFVDILPLGADSNNFLNHKVSLVFDGAGILVNYERAPNF